jgi:hypothetical protein
MKRFYNFVVTLLSFRATTWNPQTANGYRVKHGMTGKNKTKLK